MTVHQPQPQKSAPVGDSHLRTQQLLIVSKRLVIFAAVSLIATTALFAVTFLTSDRLMISWLSFECGIIGGFVSIQQRLRNINDEELSLLSHSWAMILVIPIYGGIFALVLYVLFISGLIEGELFPQFYVPAFSVPPTTQDIAEFLRTTYPSSGADFAKLMFWTFVAGFSERLVPQIISKVSSTT